MPRLPKRCSLSFSASHYTGTSALPVLCLSVTFRLQLFRCSFSDSTRPLFGHAFFGVASSPCLYVPRSLKVCASWCHGNFTMATRSVHIGMLLQLPGYWRSHNVKTLRDVVAAPPLEKTQVHSSSKLSSRLMLCVLAVLPNRLLPVRCGRGLANRIRAPCPQRNSPAAGWRQVPCWT